MPRPGVQKYELYLLDIKGLGLLFLSSVLEQVLHMPVRACDWERTGQTRVVEPPFGYDPEERLILHKVLVSYYHET